MVASQILAYAAVSVCNHDECQAAAFPFLERNLRNIRRAAFDIRNIPNSGYYLSLQFKIEDVILGVAPGNISDQKDWSLVKLTEEKYTQVAALGYPAPALITMYHGFCRFEVFNNDRAYFSDAFHVEDLKNMLKDRRLNIIKGVPWRLEARGKETLGD